MGSGPTRVSDDASTTRPLPSLLPGSLELVSPVSIGTTRRLRLPLSVSAPSLCRSVCDTSVPRLFSLTSNRGGVGRCSGPCVTGVALSGYFRGDRRLSQLPEKPCTALPCSDQTPEGPPRQTITTRRCCPRCPNTAGSSNCEYFGAQSHGFAVRCLRLKASFPIASQGSLPAAGQALPGGLVPAGSHLRLSFAHSSFIPFVVSFERHPVSSGFGWRHGTASNYAFPRGLIGENPIHKVPLHHIRRRRGVAQTLTADQARELMEKIERFENGRWVSPGFCHDKVGSRGIFSPDFSVQSAQHAGSRPGGVRSGRWRP